MFQYTEKCSRILNVPHAPIPMPMHPRGQRELEERFGGDPEELGFFLVQVAKFIQEWGATFPDEASYMGSRLDEQAAQWYVILYHAQGSKLWSVRVFMQAMREQLHSAAWLGVSSSQWISRYV